MLDSTRYVPKYKPGDILYWPQGGELTRWFFVSDINYEGKCEYIFVNIYEPNSPAELEWLQQMRGCNYWVMASFEIDALWIDNNPDIQLVSESDVPEAVIKLYKTHKLSTILEK